MLVLTRKLEKALLLMTTSKFVWCKSRANKFVLVLKLQKIQKIHREEVYAAAIQAQNQESVKSDTEATRAVSKLLKTNFCKIILFCSVLQTLV